MIGRMKRAQQAHKQARAERELIWQLIDRIEVRTVTQNPALGMADLEFLRVLSDHADRQYTVPTRQADIDKRNERRARLGLPPVDG